MRGLRSVGGDGRESGREGAARLRKVLVTPQLLSHAIQSDAGNILFTEARLSSSARSRLLLCCF